MHATRSAEQFGVVADLLPHMVWTALPDGSADYFNRRWCEYTGMSLAQSQGWNWTSAVHPRDQEQWLQAWRDAVRLGLPLERQWRLRRASDGVYRWHLARATPVRGEDGRILQWVGTSTDIDDQRKTEEVLETQAKALRDQARLLDLANDGIFVRDLSGVITFWNRGAEHLYGYTRHEAFGKDVARLLRTQFPQPYSEIEETVRRTGRWEGSLVHHRKDGAAMEIESRWALQCDAQGAPKAILEINSDATERRQAERSRKRAQEALARTAADLRRSNEELETFAYVASHDLQEPLRMIASYTQLLMRDYGPQLDEQAHKWLGVLTEGTRRMQALINDLLAYSRLGTHSEGFKPVDCNSLVQTVLKNLEVVVHETGAEVRLESLPTVQGDPSQLTQLFQNLLSNALKFRGPMRPEISITAELKDPDWVFAVRDNGIGIATKDHARIFVIFQRLHRREKYAGTGIGLAICKRVVESHGGRIWVESAPDAGAVFYFTLPSGAQREEAIHI